MNPLEKRCMAIVIDNHNKLLTKLEQCIGKARLIQKENADETKKDVEEHLFSIINKEWSEQQAWLGNLRDNTTINSH